ncbi:hypothetical protein GCM10010512_48110 [Streptomyces thermoviolaceus subsp. thermoviolaceus]|nr:hypothetical protein GCM10010499_49860 [Streptomyces thermoviolaceus subsp. apingens]GHB11069.1 hypothetical protein GCM10010512_48110 [Streptomyces thermoviolaceus subsp. thermoviolaceus]
MSTAPAPPAGRRPLGRAVGVRVLVLLLVLLVPGAATARAQAAPAAPVAVATAVGSGTGSGAEPELPDAVLRCAERTERGSLRDGVPPRPVSRSAPTPVPAPAPPSRAAERPAPAPACPSSPLWPCPGLRALRCVVLRC